MSRMKTVLKRKDGSKRLSFIGSKPTAGPSTTKEPAVTPAVVEPTIEEPKATGAPQPTKILRSTVDSERARKLAERFKVSIEPLPAGPEVEAYRVEKPIRMRIHRSCHLCHTTFGSNKVCVKCEHVRCKSCPRYPPKKVEGKGKGKTKEAVALPAGAIEPDTYYGQREEVILTMPNPKAGGQPLVRKKPMQRVRRNCHECSALFAPGSKICASCQHVRCTDCPRDPAKKKKYPDGYPGDAPSANTSIPIKYACHKCNKTFPPVPHPSTPEGVAFKQGQAPECTRCKHPLCSECPRAPPAKVEPSPDPEVLKSVQAKLAALNISTPVVASGA